MKVLHLASFDRWTGAAAPAWEEVEALRASGIDARYAFIGGSGLEAKIGHFEHAYPVIGRRRLPTVLLRSVRRLHELIRSESFDLVHAHLSHDHWLAKFALSRRSPVSLIRTFHSARAIRRDPFTRDLIARTARICVVNSSFVDHPTLTLREPKFTPPPVNHLQFTARGPDARSVYGLSPEMPVVGFIGKLAPGRGFETALEVFARVSRQIDARMMIIGHGPHRAKLENLALHLGVSARVIWAGYHEVDLAEHYRAVNVMLFTAPGSDEGHRAIIEALACGTPVAAFPIAGVRSVFGDMADDFVSAVPSVDALARRVVTLLQGNSEDLQRICTARSQWFGYPATASRLLQVYATL